MNDELKDLYEQLAATKSKATPEPEAPAQVDGNVDPVEAKMAEDLLKQFGRKGEPVTTAAPSVTAPTTTMSVTNREQEALKNLRNAETKLAESQKRIENLEKSLEVVTTKLSDLFRKQNDGLNAAAKKTTTDFQIRHYQDMLDIHIHPHQTALAVFIAWPQISEVALRALGIDDETIESWRKWSRDFQQHDHSYWLEVLADVQSGRKKPSKGQDEFLLAMLETAGVDTDKELQRISHERAQRFFAENPFHDDYLPRRRIELEKQREIDERGRRARNYGGPGWNL